MSSEGVDAWSTWNAKGKGRNNWKEGPDATTNKSGKGKYKGGLDEDSNSGNGGSWNLEDGL